MRILILSIFIVLGFIGPNTGHAQLDLGGLSGNNQPEINLQPSFPQPGQEFTATLQNANGQLQGSTLTWVFDGEEVPNSKNQRSVELVAGANGESQSIDLVFTNPDGDRSYISREITPIWLDIIIEPQTHVPEFYLGRSLPSFGSTVVARAVLSTNNHEPGDLLYTWTIGEEVIGGGSVRGQNVVSYETPRGSRPVLSLEVSDLNGQTIASRRIEIPSVEPELLFYEVNTLLGISNQAIDESVSLSGNSTIIRAEPIHLDSRVYNNPDISEWALNGQTSVNQGGNPYEVVLEKTGGSGRTNLEFHVRSQSQVSQGARGEIEINL